VPGAIGVFSIDRRAVRPFVARALLPDGTTGQAKAIRYDALALTRRAPDSDRQRRLI
jgi:hypothetical protein